jgi:preprotein translocase subunit SecY
MLRAFINMWRVPDLRNKLLFTLGMLLIYRLGFFLPLPAVDASELTKTVEQNKGGALSTIADYMSIFSGGSLKQSTLFGLGVMPYISASIIFQLLATVLPSLQALQKEGPAGRQKIQEWTRYATIPLCLVQGAFWLATISSRNSTIVMKEYQYGMGLVLFMMCGLVGLTAGSIFLMWLGEQIDKYGIGNGVSLIITAGIVDRIPNAIHAVASDFSVRGDKRYSPMAVLALAIAFIIVVAGSIVITQGQRRIPIQQAKHTRGRRVYGGQKTYLPLRVNHGGVMPIIFASSLMIFPAFILKYLQGVWPNAGILSFLARNLGNVEGAFLYILCYIALIYFFAYFWTTVQFQPKEMATQLRDSGSFIPGLRPGPRTAEYLETVMERITYVGAGFLAVIAVIPAAVRGMFHVDYAVSAFLGGTGLLIVVSVMLDFVQRVEASLMMRNYQGFLGGGGSGSGPRIRGSRGMT